MRICVLSFAIVVAAIGMLASGARATFTVECVPLGGASVTSGQTVEIECFATSDTNFFISGYILDFPCSLSGSPGSMGTLSFAGYTVDPDGTGFHGPSTGGVPLIFQLGNYPSDPLDCRIAGQTCAACPPALLPMATIRYVGTISYEVSECAGGEYVLSLENYSVPAQEGDPTRVRSGDHSLVQVVNAPLLLAVRTGVCCLGGECVGEEPNATCCESQHTGSTFITDATCSDPMICQERACCQGSGACSFMTSSACGELGGFALPPNVLCDNDFDGDGLDSACGDACPLDSTKSVPGPCGCGVVEADSNNDGVIDCLEPIPTVSHWGLVILGLSLLIAGKIHGNVLEAAADSPTG